MSDNISLGLLAIIKNGIEEKRNGFSGRSSDRRSDGGQVPNVSRPTAASRMVDAIPYRSSILPDLWVFFQGFPESGASRNSEKMSGSMVVLGSSEAEARINIQILVSGLRHRPLKHCTVPLL